MKVAKVGFKSKSRVQRVRRKVDEVRLEEKHPARVALRLALAHKIQREIDAGEYEDMADVARAHGLTRARLSQIMGLLFLAPDIQEQVLALRYAPGREAVSERVLRQVLGSLVWAEQRVIWWGVEAPQGSLVEALLAQG